MLQTKTTPKIELQGVIKSFGSKHVLRGIDLSIAPQESMVVIGGSGTGKSVMLKSILSILTPDNGSIKIDGQETVSLRGRRRDEHLAKFG
ncbi:MAG: ATP-binding cassette domain-containing protein, partial [Bdellovibrionales bacterium]